MAVDCTASGLANLAKCFCFDTKTQLAVQTYLLCQIANSTGTGGLQITSGVGPPVNPPANPAIANLYINTTDGTLFSWPAGASAWI